VTPEASRDTQATLLLSAPLTTSTTLPADPILKPTEFRAVRARIVTGGGSLGDLLGPSGPAIVADCADLVPVSRINDLLARGFRLAQALDQWAARSIWVVGTTDEAYPTRLRDRFGDDAPQVLYGCGNPDLVRNGGLAVVGSRDCDDDSLAWTTEIGHRAARSRCTIVSGAARGVDLTAMGAALAAGGTAVGVIAEALFREVLNVDFRDHLQDGTLALVSPNDPRQRFFAFLRMQRNKYIYALADSALVVASGLKQGGTWAGAEEQVRRLRHVPVYVRVPEASSLGLDALRALGAHAWPDPKTPAEFARVAQNTEPSGNSADKPLASVSPASTVADPTTTPTPAAIQQSFFDL
jgi:DNA processing protein